MPGTRAHGRRARIAIAAASAFLVWPGLASAEAASAPLSAPASATQPAAADAVPDAAPPEVEAALPASRIERAWFEAGPRLRERGDAARVEALKLGAVDGDAAARALLAGDAGVPEARLALELSPQLPAAHVALARAFWNEGEWNEALKRGAAALLAVPRNLEAQLWLGSSSALMLVLVLIAACLAFIGLAMTSVASSAMHDLGDFFSRSTPGFARLAMLSALILLPVSLGEGIMGLALAAFGIAFAYGSGRLRFALAACAALLALAVGPLASVAGRGLVALDSDPIAAAADAVLRGRANAAERELLETNAADDELASHVLAIDARRRGDDATAAALYEDLLRRDPSDAVATANLGTLVFEGGQTERAIELFERAALQLPTAVLFFDLSQAYARAFRMEEFEGAMLRAQRLDPDRVGRLSAYAAEREAVTPGATTVADIPFSTVRLRERLLASSTGEALPRELLGPLAPGWLGASWRSLVLAFAGMSVFSLLVASRFEASSRCRRCGDRVCGRCDGAIWSKDTCEVCHRFFRDPDSTDPQLRAARLARLRARNDRLARLSMVASFVFPGAGGLLARRPGLGLLALICFAWAVAALWFGDGLVAEPLALGVLAPAVFAASGALALAAYLLIAFVTVLLQRGQAAS